MSFGCGRQRILAWGGAKLTRRTWPEGEIPLTHGRLGSADDVADAVLFLGSGRSRHIGGTPIGSDGGQGLLR
jgi:NAD(P)-dependent dehydrogenase (short-subunit alcohol dehydrogenase family)